MRSILEQKNKPDGSVCSCDDPIRCLTHMFCDMVQKKRVAQGQCPARRPVFLRTHGIIRGFMIIREDLPDEYRQGIFSHAGEHPVYVRYSSDLADGRPDWESTIGIGIKIFGIPGKKRVDDNGADTADILMQNCPYFFVDNAWDMCNFTKASFEGWSDEWISQNAPATNELLDGMAKPIRSVLETSLWSVVPFRLGDRDYCKYLLRPRISTNAGSFDINDPNFLAKDLTARMAAGEVILDIYIQRRPSPEQWGEAYLEEHFPLDRATVVWDTRVAVPEKAATIILPTQDITVPEQQIYGDWLAFNIGRVPFENEPVGSIAEARIQVYQTSADYRREKNEQPVSEPTAPGEPKVENPKCPFPGHQPDKEEPRALTPEEIERITHVRIHPGIGIARVGNSRKAYYIGPELMEPEPTQFGATRDDTGAIKRQAARFRVYGYDKFGNVVAEIQQSENSSVEWSVHVSNKKAAWYQFNAAMDIPATVTLTVPLRNASVSGNGRDALCIDPGKKTIMGISMNDSSYAMTGNFQGTPVMLGELRTDDVGRLIVLPGFGTSASPSNKPVYRPEDPDSFNNADGWYDDIADGPVYARVTVGGMDFDADPAWVASAPPNFAPDLVGWRTMDDLLRNVYMQSGMMPVPQTISFNEHVRPILQRLTEMQWLNKGYLSMFGADAPMNFSDPALMRKLSFLPDNRTLSDPYMELRRTIYNSFRPLNTMTVEERAWPWFYGDAFGYTNPNPVVPPSPATYLQLPPFYDYVLTNWVEGLFLNDYDPDAKSPSRIEEVNLQRQPEMLDRAAMHFCLADAFHPGAELTWPMRNPSMFRAPYRIRMLREGQQDPTYGSTLDNATVMSVNGPLYGQGPGGLTRWMALPWQGDTAYCRSGYDYEYDPYLPTFWPARVPNQVLTEEDYDILCDTRRSMETRIAAFQDRKNWLRQLPATDTPPQQMMYMIAHFGDMGILESRPRPEDMPWLPDQIYVENLTKAKRLEVKHTLMLFREAAEQANNEDRRLTDAGWVSEEHRNAFLAIKRRGR